MKKKFFALLIVAAVMTAPMAMAQDAPQFANYLTVHTNLSDGAAYEANLKKIFAAFKKVGFPSPIQVSQTTSEPGAYNFLVPFSDWAEYGQINAKIQEAYASIPDVMAATQETFTHSDQSIFIFRTDLAYAASSPRIAAGTAGFTRLTYIHPHPEHLLAFEGLMQEFAALNKKNGNPNGTAVAQLMVGPNAPSIVIAGVGKSAADFFAESAKWQEKNGAAAQALLQKAGPMINYIEYQELVPRPDLNYTP